MCIRDKFQTLYFLPYVTSTLAIGLVFRWLFHSEYGYINFFLEFLGLEPQKWLSDPNLTIVAVTIFTIWSGMAFKIVLFLAGLQKIDQQYYLSLIHIWAALPPPAGRASPTWRRTRGMPAR